MIINRPLLVIPIIKHGDREKGLSGYDQNVNIARPSVTRQSIRINPKFDRLRTVLAKPSSPQGIELRSEPDGIAPERALVFELAGTLNDFYSQVQRIPGLEFMFEEDAQLSSTDEFYLKQVTKKPNRGDGNESSTEERRRVVDGRIYVTMPDLKALREILRLWDFFRSGSSMPLGFAPWKDLFSLLVDLRVWGPTDRLLPETLAYFSQSLEDPEQQEVSAEIELWAYENADRAVRAEASVRSLITELGGSIVHTIRLPSIRYHALLVLLPRQRIAEILDHSDVTVATVDDVMFVRPQSSIEYTRFEDTPDELSSDERSVLDLRSAPIAALIDGVPLANHALLTNRLIIEDQDHLENIVAVEHRSHGTSMASLMLYGDLSEKNPPVSRPIYVRPVLQYDSTVDAETISPQKLPTDIMFEATNDLIKADRELHDEPSLFMVNLSLGDRNRRFSGSMSPWARAIDFLAFKHRLLFVISAGNILDWLPLASLSCKADFLALTDTERETVIIAALNSEKSRRSIISPSEAINGITVGADHSDSQSFLADDPFFYDPYKDEALPNISSAVGLGHRRSIKPDMLFSGGRELVRLREDGGHLWLQVLPSNRTGQLSASPDFNGTGRVNKTTRTVGTSNSAALITHSAMQIYDALIEADHVIPQHYSAVVIKALLIHSTSWGEAAARFRSVFGPAGHAHARQKDDISRFLGYGRPNVSRVLNCAPERATLFMYDELAFDKQVNVEIPLPQCIEHSRELRRLTITLAWLSPINSRNKIYRAATLKFGPIGDKQFSLAVDRLSSQPDHHSVDRGTVTHSIFEGENAVAFLEEGMIKLRVFCQGQAGPFDEKIPFCLAISFEVGSATKLAIYDEVRQRVAEILATQTRISQ